MGPAAWAAVGRALAVAVGRTALFSDNGAIALIAREIRNSILKNDFKVAEALLNDLYCRHRKVFEEFTRKYKDDLPEDFLDQFGL